MASVITTEWLEARIAATQAQILAVEAAITSVTGGAQSYTLDTGQTRQTVTKSTLGELRKTLEYLESRLRGYDQQVNGKTHNYARPGW